MVDYRIADQIKAVMKQWQNAPSDIARAQVHVEERPLHFHRWQEQRNLWHLLDIYSCIDSATQHCTHTSITDVIFVENLKKNINFLVTD